MPTQVGRASVFGVNGAVNYTGVGTLIALSAEMNHEFDIDELKNASGDILTAVFNGEKKRLRLGFRPVAAVVTNTIVNARLSLEMPTFGSKVVLTLFDDEDLNGDWFYAGGTMTLNHDGPAEMVFNLLRWLPDIGDVVT